MDPIKNPFAPGAGNKPPELAGRHLILNDAKAAIQRALIGKSVRAQMFLGLRGVGKTVLLKAVENIAKEHDHLTTFIEAPEGKSLSELLLPRIHQVLRKLSTLENAKAKTHQAMRALKSFASVIKIEYGDMSIAVEPEVGVADSGDLEYDLPDLFVSIGEAAKAAGKAWTLLIDEVQYLNQKDLSALIVALHRISQENLPVLFFGAGLPQVAALSGEAKSYAERLFHFPEVAALSEADAREAIRQPVHDENAVIDESALTEIVSKTRGYPYFLQEWGHQSWNIATGDTITLHDARLAEEATLKRLDEGFFKVRFDRLTSKEREYVVAMAKLGNGPYRSAAVAQAMGETMQALGPPRAQLISKGMIYSPAHGNLAFTVPMFNDYLMRNLATIKKIN
ncbi:MAG: ATP-binding protein [Duganella sp.]